MRVGVFSGPAAAARPEDLLAVVRAAPEMAGAQLADEVSTDQPYVVEAVGEQAVHRRRDRPWHQGHDAAPDGRARHAGARAARDLNRRGDHWPCSPTGSSSPTVRAIRPRPTGGRRAAGAAGAAGVPLLRDLLRQPAARPGAGLRHLQAGLRPPRHQPAGAWTAPPARSRSPPTTTASPSTPRSSGTTDDAVRRGRGQPRLPQRRRRRRAAASGPDVGCWPSRCSTTPRPRPVRTTRATSSTGSPT